MILVDSSAWVEYDRATGSDIDLELTRLIAEGVPIAVTEAGAARMTIAPERPGRHPLRARLHSEAGSAGLLVIVPVFALANAVSARGRR